MERMEGVIQPYAWGSHTFIPELLGTEPTGDPQAELWLGAHSSAPGRVGGRPLDELVGTDPDTYVGAAAVAEFGPVLPFLLKVLAAAEPLSLQAHPSRAQAEAGFAAEEAAGLALDAPDRTYKDSWPKPEMLCALSEADVLCGFREPAETYRLFAQLGVPTAVELMAPLQDGSAPALRQAFGRIMTMGAGDLQVVTDVIDAARQVRGGPLAEFAQTARDLAERYPEDPGVLAALVMNRVRLQPYEAVFLSAGNLHAYLRGSGVEIMANSNNVLRGGLTSKHVNVDELLRVLDFTSGFPNLVETVEEHPGVWAYRTPAPEFALWRLQVDRGPVPVPAARAGRVLLVIEGALTAHTDDQELTVTRGQSVFLTAGEDPRLEGSGVGFLAGPGVG